MIHEKRNNKDHRIALQKRLAKAKKRLGITDDVPTDKVQVPTQNKPKQRVHMVRKPDPVKPLLHAAKLHKDTLCQSKSAAEQAARTRQAHQDANMKRREKERGVYGGRTSRGQPRLSAQIGLLLEKLKR